MLRWWTPVMNFRRTATRDTELAGVALPAGSRLMVLWASGNRDEHEWPHADQVDLARPRATRHLAFGPGLHRCLGAQLARLEVRVVLEELLARPGTVELDGGPLRYRNSAFVRTLEALPVRLC